MITDDSKNYTVEQLKKDLDAEERKKWSFLEERILTLQGCNANLTDRLKNAQLEIVTLQNRCHLYTDETLCVFCGLSMCKYHPIQKMKDDAFVAEARTEEETNK